MTFYLLTAAILATATALSLWTAMAWPEQRADLTAGLLGGAAVAVWSVFNGAHPGPQIGTLPFHLADLGALPALLVSSLLVGRTFLLRGHPYRPATPDPGDSA